MIKFLKKLNIIPNNISIYQQAFTHPKYANEHPEQNSYQRLEFVGDGLINAAVAIYLYINFANLNEGEMTLLRAKIVNQQNLSLKAKELGIGKMLIIDEKDKHLGRHNSILADLFESLAASIYIDQSDKTFWKFLELTLLKDISKIAKKELKDNKTLFQEFLQQKKYQNLQLKQNISFQNLKIKQTFRCKIFYKEILIGEGSANSKKHAQQLATKKALKKMKHLLKNEIN